jgi:glycosyltransferase involved in cell wall biosynthesis
VVASRGGVNDEIVRDGESGFCVDDPQGWVAAIDRLIADPALRQRMGDAGRRRVERDYSLRVLAPRFADILRRAAGAS